MEWFCFPQGLFLLSAAAQPAPHVSSFVRFTSGVRSYGLCLTFYRQVGVLDEEKENEEQEEEEDEQEEEELSVSGGGEGRGLGGRGSGRVLRRGGAGRRQQRQRRELLWCPVCLCVLTHIPVLEGLMHWLRMFHWCLVRLEREAVGGRRRLGAGPTELDAAVFQLTLEVRTTVVVVPFFFFWFSRTSRPFYFVRVCKIWVSCVCV